MRILMRKAAMLTATAALTASLAGALTGAAPAVAATTPIQVYGVWLCGSDQCVWGSAPNMTTFDQQNNWIINRGDGNPSVNVVVLAFVNPLKLLDGTTDSGDTNGVPNGMDSAVVSYFTSHGIRVMVSIGGQTYTGDWDTALSQNGTLLGQKAAALATQLGVGVEIDYENSSSPNLTGLQNFVSAYRAVHPYDATGADPTARLTVDLGAGDRYLIPLASYATRNWLSTSNPVLDYAIAMVPSRQPSTSTAEANWQQHLAGAPRQTPPIPPLAPARLAVSLFIDEQNSVLPECNNFAASLQNSTSSWVESAAPEGAGTTSGLLGYMFWAAGSSSTKGQNTFPPNSCQNGVGTGAIDLGVPIPMPALRQS